jgi:hypothetical protein
LGYSVTPHFLKFSQFSKTTFLAPRPPFFIFISSIFLPFCFSISPPPPSPLPYPTLPSPPPPSLPLLLPICMTVCHVIMSVSCCHVIMSCLILQTKYDYQWIILIYKSIKHLTMKTEQKQLTTKRFVIRQSLIGTNTIITFTNKKGELCTYDHDKVYNDNKSKFDNMSCFIKYKSYTCTNNLPTFAR